jgi:hypothetical protein
VTDPRNDPTTFSLLTYAWVLGLSFWGGLASFIGKHKRGEVRAFNIVELLGELVVSGLSGVLTFYLCTWAKFDPLLSAAFVGVSGHMGSRAIMQLEKIAERRANKLTGGSE